MTPNVDPITFFNKANELMVKNSPAAADKEMLEKIAAVNIGPGMEFDTSVLTGDVAENWKTMLTEIQLKLIKEGQKFSKKLGQWDYFGEPIGDFNTEYAYRALVALAGLGANTVEVALYPKTEQDAPEDTSNWLPVGDGGFHLYMRIYTPDMDARYLCADALEQLGYQAEAGPWRSAYLCAAQELRNGTNTDDATRGKGTGDVVSHMTPEMILDYLGILVDTTKVSDLTFTANLVLPEGNYVLRVKNGVLLYQKDTQDADADVTWTTKRAGLLSIIQKNTENIAALIQQEGDETCLTRLMDAVTVTSEYKYFNIIEP